MDKKHEEVKSESTKKQKVSLNDFTNHKRKLVVQNIPSNEVKEDIMKFFQTVLA